MIRLSTKGRYATRIMVRLAMGHGQRPVQKKAIAAAEGISADYVEQLLTRLKSGGFVRSHRGVGGGFSLIKEPASVTVADVVECVEGPMSLVPCVDGECERASVCATRDVWLRVTQALIRELSGSNIAELAETVQELEASKSLMFEI